MVRKSAESLAALVRKCQDGDDGAWNELMDMSSPVECFDIFGQVSYALVTHIDNIKSPNKVISYVATATKRAVANHFRSADRVDHIDINLIDEFSEAFEGGPDEKLQLNRRSAALAEALSILTDKERMLLRLLFFEGDRPDYKRVSEVLDIPESSIGPTRARSLAKLRKVLEEWL